MGQQVSEMTGRKTNRMNIGIVYDLFDDYPWREGDPPDADAENEPPETLEVIEDALRLLGHVPVRLGSPFGLASKLANDELRESIHAAVNIAEAARTRNREAYAPVMLEMAGIPFVGTDAIGLSVSLDKAWTKDLVQAAGIRTPSYRCYTTSNELKDDDLPDSFPMFVKPRFEGSSKGITRKSRVESFSELQNQVDWCLNTYQQDVIVEEFVKGSEFTVAVVGSNPVRALPPIQRAVDAASGIGLHALERRGYDGRTGAPSDELSDGFELPGDLTPELDVELQQMGLAAFRKLECRDFARVDFRVDHLGVPWFLEINPLPTFAPDGTLAIQAELEGRTYVAFLAEIFSEALFRVHPDRHQTDRS
jgi:D-alanine-D-alanine ligase